MSIDAYLFLKGIWHIERFIQDRAGPYDNGKVNGTAVWHDPGGFQSKLAYKEHGSLCYGNYCGEIFQRYTYHFINPEQVHVHFLDGSLFYKWRIKTKENRVVHYCGDDNYNGCIILSKAGQMIHTWNIQGPRKNMQIETIYTRF